MKRYKDLDDFCVKYGQLVYVEKDNLLEEVYVIDFNSPDYNPNYCYKIPKEEQKKYIKSILKAGFMPMVTTYLGGKYRCFTNKFLSFDNRNVDVPIEEY